MPNLLKSHDVKLVVVSNIFEILTEVKQDEARKICYNVRSILTRICRQNVLVLVTSWKNGAHSDLIKDKADVVARFDFNDKNRDAFLIKHPHRPFLKASQQIINDLPRSQMLLAGEY